MSVRATMELSTARYSSAIPTTTRICEMRYLVVAFYVKMSNFPTNTCISAQDCRVILCINIFKQFAAIREDNVMVIESVFEL